MKTAITFFLWLMSAGLYGEARLWPKGKDYLRVELEAGVRRDSPIRYDAASGGRTVVLDRDSSRIEVRIKNEVERNTQMWVRCYFDYERCETGDANSFFWELDEGNQNTCSHEQKDAWLWVRMGDISLSAGEHGFVFEPRERPCRLDVLVLYSGQEATRESWYLEDYPEGLPYDLPNSIPGQKAVRVSHWRLVGERTRDISATLDPKARHELARSIHLRLRGGDTNVVLVSGRAIRSAPLAAPELQPKAVSMNSRGATAAVQISVIGTDAQGTYWRSVFPSPSGDGWRRATVSLPQELLAPVEITHLVFQNQGQESADVWFEEPDFAMSAEARSKRGIPKAQEGIPRQMTSEREQAAGAFRFDPGGKDTPLRTRDGRVILPDQVEEFYGKEFVVLADGVDVCSQAYADQISNLRLHPKAYDLSDQAGWPDVSVTPGDLAIDPSSGRFTFSEGNGEQWAEVGFCRTGFGVPGLAVAVGNGLAVAPAGEGDMTFLDVTDVDHLRIAGILPTWHFAGGPPFLRGPWLTMTFRVGGQTPTVMFADVNDPLYPGKLRPTNLSDAVLLWMDEAGRKAVYLNRQEPPSLVCAEIPSPGHFEATGLLQGVDAAIVREDLAAAAMVPSDQTRRRPDILLVDLADGQKPKILARIANETRLLKERETERLIKGELCALSKRFLVVRYGAALEVIRVDDPSRPVWLAAHDFEDRLTFPSCVLSESHLFVTTGSHLLAYDLRSFRPLSEEELLFQNSGDDAKGAVPGQEVWDEGGRSRKGALPSPVERPEALADFPEPAAVFAALEGWQLQGITWHQGLLYVSDADFGLRIFELKGNKFQLCGSCATAAEGRFAFSIADGLAAIGHTFGGQLWVVDTTNPTRPRPRGILGDGYRLRYASRHTHRYPCLYLAKESGRVEAVDLTDPDHPRVVWHALDAKGEAIDAADLRVAFDRLFIVGRDCKLFEFDCRNPKEPQRLSVITLSEKPQHFRITEWNHHVYALGQLELVAVEVSEPGAPRIAGRLDVSDHVREVTEGFQGNPTVSSMTVVRGVLFATTGGLTGRVSREGGLTKLDRYDVRNPSEMRSLGLFDPHEAEGWGNWYGDVISYGKRLFSATYLQMEMTDVTSPFEPVRLPSHSRFGQSMYQFSVGDLRGRYLYVPAIGGLAILRPPLPPEKPQGQVRGVINP